MKPKGWAIAEAYFLGIYRFQLHLGAGGLREGRGQGADIIIKYLLLPVPGS